MTLAERIISPNSPKHMAYWCYVVWLLRKFMFLENVSNILKMVDVMAYLLQAGCCLPSHSSERTSMFRFKYYSNSNLGKECRKRGLLIRWVTLNGHHVGAPVWPSETSTVNIFKDYNCQFSGLERKDLFLGTHPGLQSLRGGFDITIKCCHWLLVSIHARGSSWLTSQRWKDGPSAHGMSIPSPPCLSGCRSQRRIQQRLAWKRWVTLWCPM